MVLIATDGLVTYKQHQTTTRPVANKIDRVEIRSDLTGDFSNVESGKLIGFIDEEVPWFVANAKAFYRRS